MSTRTILVNVRFSPEELAPLQELARQVDRPLSYVVRMLAIKANEPKPAAARTKATGAAR